MAVKVVRSTDIEVTREQVHAWLVQFYNQKQEKSMRKFLVKKLGQEHDVLVQANGARGRDTPLIDVLLADVSSYVLDLT
jgi:hypothetical protein